jgi:HAD superfamily hydrolase (TIGR01509 family)
VPRFDAILFDFDGVLADTEPVHWACWAEVLEPLGVTLSWEYYRNHCMGVDDREMLRLMAAAAQPPRAWEDLFAHYPTKKELFRARTLEAPPFDAALGPLLERLHRTYKLAVVTSSARTEIDPLLTAGGLRDHFDALVCGREAGAHKPAPEPYLLAARLVRSTAPLVVEDSPAGIAAARAAGFEVLHIPRTAELSDLLRQTGLLAES